MTKKTLIFVLDIKNTQRDYALCLEFIKTIEKRRLNGDDQELLLNIGKQIKIFSGFVNKTGSPKYFEQPIQKRINKETTEVESQIEEKHIFCTQDLQDIKNNRGEVRYHLRIKINSNKADYINLQYLALLMKRVDSLGFFEKSTQNKLTAFIKPCSGDVYPFYDSYIDFDQDTYMLVSQYLRLLAKKYNGVIFGALLEKNKVSITALDFKKADKFDTYFPIIPVTKEVYTKLFERQIEPFFLEGLFKLSKNNRFGNAADENPEVALVDFVAETSYKRLQQKIEDSKIVQYKQEIKNISFEILCKENINLIELSLFAFLFGIGEVHNISDIEKVVYNTLSLSKEICYGLKQIAQNAIQHSEGKECVITFFLHYLFNEYIEKIDDDSLLLRDVYSISEHGEVLEIVVSDLNELQDMCENFVSNLKYEVKESETKTKELLSGHNLLINNFADIKISHFFSEYDDFNENSLIKRAWSKFRSDDVVGHVGLSLFAITAEKCDAVVKVISSKNSSINKDTNVFVKNYHTNTIKAIGGDSDYVIPGTQFQILIPVKTWNKKKYTGLGKLNYENYAKEDYVTFAKFVEYEVYEDENKYVKYTDGNSSSATDAEEKYKEMLKWMGFWNRRFKKNIEAINKEKCVDNVTKKQECKKVFVHDFVNVCHDEYFKNENTMEVCMKGLIGCLNLIKKVECNAYIAILNTPIGTIETLKRILVLLGIREFPDNLQLFICEEEHENSIVLLGDDYSHVVYNSYLLSLEHGTNGFNKNDCVKVQELKNKLSSVDEMSDALCSNELGAFPFDAILKASSDSDKTLFEEKIEKIAEEPIDEKPMGYRLRNTHMRLGSKLHIDSFYEMSFLFYRTTIANRIAFLILRKLIYENKENEIDQAKDIIDIKKDNIIFYGYASYSKAILTSITEITKLYRKLYSDKKIQSEEYIEKIGFASYQHNLQSESEKIQMYYYLPKGFHGEIDGDNNLVLSKNTKIIQIVPISTTLTTFDKMWAMLCESTVDGKFLRLYANYTIYWVKDELTIEQKMDKKDEQSSKQKSNNEDEKKTNQTKEQGIASKYISNVESNRVITTRFEDLMLAGNGEVCYFMCASVNWHDPLRCKLCYPNNVIDEIPLIETDATSTVPTQQIRYMNNMSKEWNDRDLIEKEKRNSDRIRYLRNCVSYGHICRRQNHYQFYIDTQKYFYNVKDDVKRWLTEIKKDNVKGEYPVLNIIFSPEHNTNVGFAQYVNTYYFGGLAEIVSFNVDKQFRSNFICEHAALIEIISKLHQDEKDLPVVKFYFVDDTIISGETFEKANSFLQSLIPQKERGKYSANLFSKVFLLVDRLSNATKGMYVRDVEKDFISYVHIDISNIRTQGDSCIGCKLEQDAEKMFKRSPTKKLARHWAKKVTNYKKISYDNRKNMKGLYNENSYYKLIVSHVLQNIIVNSGKAYDLGEAYDCLLDICLWMISDDETISVYEELLGDIKGMHGLYIVLKTICRPFFLYDFKIRHQVLTLYVMLSEMLFGLDDCVTIISDKKPFLNRADRIKRTKKLAKNISAKIVGEELSFIQNYLFEGLVDMGSTYPMRKQTITKAYDYIIRMGYKYEQVAEFWDNYAVNVYRLVANNADETKELWLECLYLSGKEYEEIANVDKFKPRSLYEEIIKGDDEHKLYNKLFYSFCNELFLQNTGISFDALERLKNNRVHNEIRESDDEKSQDEICENEIKNYFYEYWKHMRCLSDFSIYKHNKEDEIKQDESKQCIFKRNEQIELFKIMNNKADDDDTSQNVMKSVSEWYDEFLNKIKGMIFEKYEVKKDDINIALITDKKDALDRMQSMDFVKASLSFASNTIEEEKFSIKDRIIKALENKAEYRYDLENAGYYINDNESDSKYIIIFFDNPDVKGDISKISLMKFERVFLYIGFRDKESIKENVDFVLKFILRDILTYRNRIIRRLEKDFYSDIFSKYAHTIGEKNILSHEKAKSHSTTADDEATIEMLVRPDVIDTEYKEFRKVDEEREVWLLLRNYTNGQIAKLFNRIFSDDTEQQKMPLYLEDEHEKNSSMLILEQLDNKNFSAMFLFKKQLRYFSDLQLEEDGRFVLLKRVINLNVYISDDIEFIRSNMGEYYNLEYFKCILIDILLSAIKYSSDREKFLSRIDRFLQIKKYLNNTTGLTEDAISDYEKQQCRVWIFREQTSEDVDYLVIRNVVDDASKNLDRWEDENKKIDRRLKDPLDVIDGHMSMLTIKRYIEKISHPRLKCEFKYIEKNSIKDSYIYQKRNLYFETRLPVLKRKE